MKITGHYLLPSLGETEENPPDENQRLINNKLEVLFEKSMKDAVDKVTLSSKCKTIRNPGSHSTLYCLKDHRKSVS